MSKKLLGIGLGLVALLLLWAGISIYPDLLWFRNMGFSPVFWTMLLSRFGFGFLVWFLMMIIVGVNLYFANRAHPGRKEGAFKAADDYFSQLGLSSRTLNSLLIAVVLIVSFYIASRAAGQWDLVMRYLYQQPFANVDPIFGRDLGFYVFSLPFYSFIQNGLIILTFLSGLITIGWYLKNGALKIEGDLIQAEGAPPALPEISISPKAKQHLIFLAGIIVMFLSWGYYLKIYGLMYSTQGPAFGASFTDVNIKIFAYWILIVVTLGFAGVLIRNAFTFKMKSIWVSGGIWLGSVVVLVILLPLLVQKFVVKPNELVRESPYIEHNIAYTRDAYNLNRIKEVDFEVSDQLTAEDLRQNDTTIQNIRIWDERPLLQTYRQIQSIRLYYDFHNVDVDRYVLKGQYRQIMLAARELVVDQLPPQANTWVNRHLTYTHGYGVAASPVNEVTSEGLPRLFIKDLPPSYEPGLEILRPEIYYGEKTDTFALVNTKSKEFDYPKGDKNVYTTYQGKGGVPVSSFLRRLLFAIEFYDPQILFTTSLTPESRIMYNRRIGERAGLIAPFLDYDADPYMVVSGGRLYWIRDAYTTTDMYPYSLRSYGYLGNKRLNYIRNSVKITIDAYNGDVTFYVIDETDPIIQTYRRIFPKLFKPFEEMPADLQKHIRYPKDLFDIQAATYTKYHMEDVQVFYNQEDLWQLPDELYGDQRQELKPYYIIIKLPEGEKEEFLLMLPFTPSKKDNMIGWLAARSDLPNYGNLLAYKLPKDKLVYGPMQIEARVDQQTEISRELSLWGQRGSRVIRGNLLVIPIGDTFINVEPVYLEAKQEKSESATAPPSRGFTPSRGRGMRGPSASAEPKTAALPELKRVIVAFSNRVVMEETLEKALSRIVGEDLAATLIAAPSGELAEGASSTGALALEHYNKAKDFLRQGNWAGYGKELNALEKILKDLAATRKEGTPSEP
ncbi:MAG: UPF0182 family protein [Desulfobacterales bacterium]